VCQCSAGNPAFSISSELVVLEGVNGVGSAREGTAEAAKSCSHPAPALSEQIVLKQNR